MTEHFTRNTVSAEFYCSWCGKRTQHRIDGVRKGPCLECVEKVEKLDAARELELRRVKQLNLFGEST